MTPEQELTAMIEDEMLRIACQHQTSHWRDAPVMSRHMHDEILARREIGNQSQLSLLYWLATDPDDMVH